MSSVYSWSVPSPGRNRWVVTCPEARSQVPGRCTPVVEPAPIFFRPLSLVLSGRLLRQSSGGRWRTRFKPTHPACFDRDRRLSIESPCSRPMPKGQTDVGGGELLPAVHVPDPQTAGRVRGGSCLVLSPRVALLPGTQLTPVRTKDHNRGPSQHRPWAPVWATTRIRNLWCCHEGRLSGRRELIDETACRRVPYVEPEPLTVLANPDQPSGFTA